MSKLYAIRDKETGRFLYRAGNKWTLEPFNGEFWLEGTPAFLSTTMAMSEKELRTKLELVTLHVEPTEPCEHCENPPEQYIVEEVAPRCPVIVVDRRSVPSNLCPNCGRSLT